MRRCEPPKLGAKYMAGDNKGNKSSHNVHEIDHGTYVLVFESDGLGLVKYIMMLIYNNFWLFL